MAEAMEVSGGARLPLTSGCSSDADRPGFPAVKEKGEKALIPFITAGDPDLATTRALALEMAARGADILELGDSLLRPPGRRPHHPGRQPPGHARRACICRTS